MPRIQVMSSRGDDLMAEWGSATTPEDAALIRRSFEDLRAKGFTPFTSKSGVRVKNFVPEIDEDIIFIAPLIGG